MDDRTRSEDEYKAARDAFFAIGETEWVEQCQNELQELRGRKS